MKCDQVLQHGKLWEGSFFFFTQETLPALQPERPTDPTTYLPAHPQDAVAEAAPAVLGALGDREPSNHPAVWEALLSFARAYPAGWASVNLHKAVLPRLWALLRHAGWGSAEGSFPAVLPLVTLLPQVRRAGGPTVGWAERGLTSVQDDLQGCSVRCTGGSTNI